MTKKSQKISSKAKEWTVIGIIVLVLTLLIIANQIFRQKAATPNNPNPGNLPGIQTGDAPWSAGLTHLRERLNQIGLRPLAQEGTALHIHQHLDIFIDGKPVAIPAGIGIDQGAGFIADIHTHDGTGIIHVESPVRKTFYLGQFFDIWGVDFTSGRIGGYKNQGDKSLKVFVNGSLYSGDPRQIALEDHQEIVITYGTNQELPSSIPSKYNFPVGY
ncbi:MAG: hypothetical protein M1505_02095 [Patescibacteria group bacterium]|nr:hypothetical protein [Patescibacteria group bacterium]MCL5257996.1 hypothetical protein [Patescibacteria group bacterium]